MYAVIETGGKQYRVEVGTELEVELLDAEPGQAITLDRVLLVADGDEATIGRPVVADAAVEAEVLGRDRGEKLIAFKYKPKTRRRVKKGHRQELLRLRITDVRLGDRSAAEATRAADDAARKDRERLEEAARRQAAEDAALAEQLKLQAAKAAPKTRKAKAEPAENGETAEAADTADTADTASTVEEAPSKAAPKRSRAKAAAAEPEATAEPQTGGEAGEAETETTETDAKPAPRKRTTRAKKDDA
jgi:large subunit ribosomal protein L21